MTLSKGQNLLIGNHHVILAFSPILLPIETLLFLVTFTLNVFLYVFSVSGTLIFLFYYSNCCQYFSQRIWESFHKTEKYKNDISSVFQAVEDKEPTQLIAMNKHPWLNLLQQLPPKILYFSTSSPKYSPCPHCSSY